MAIDQSQRPRFYENEYLGAEDLNAAVEYGRVQNARHALGAHTWGIAMGLQLKDKPATAGSGQVDMYIQPGYAWDGFGRPIVVLAPYKIPPERFSSIPYNAAIDGGTPAGRLITVWLRYDETETQGPRPGFQVCDPADQFARIQESFQIEVGNRPNNSDQRDPVMIAGRAIDASQALQIFDPGASSVNDASIPYQIFPDDNPHALWLIPLGYVRWKPNSNPSQPGNFVTLTDDDRTKSRRFRRYIGVVAEGVQAADDIIRMRRRTKDDFGKPWTDDLVWVEGDLRVNGDTKLFGGKLDFRDSTGQNNDIPLAIQRNSFMAPSQPGGGAPQTVTELQVVIGQSNDANNRFAIGPIQKGVPSAPDVFKEEFIVRADGKVGIGTVFPARKLHVEDTEIHSGGAVAGFSFGNRQTTTFVENPTVGERWVWYASTGTARLWSGNDKLVITPAGDVGIGTTTPARKLHVESTEIHSGGNGAGFSFGNRQTTTFVENPTTGERWVWYSWAGTARLWSGSDKLIVTPVGSVGIGTTAPAEKLDVRGNIKLHFDGSLYAVGGVENLRMVRGTVRSDGMVVDGNGFTVAHVGGSGVYTISFVPVFLRAPSGSVTQVYFNGGAGGDTRDNAVIIEIALQYAKLKTGDSTGNAADRDFTFFFAGPR
jgi:hypothetical protein